MNEVDIAGLEADAIADKSLASLSTTVIIATATATATSMGSPAIDIASVATSSPITA